MLFSIAPNLIPHVAVCMGILAIVLGVFSRFVWNVQHSDMAEAAGDTPQSVLAGLPLAAVQSFVLVVVAGALGALIGHVEKNPYYTLAVLGFLCLYHTGFALQYMVCGQAVVSGIKRQRNS